ncbi:hypothetical protein RugamoR64_62250 [Duganella rhizosphaerae]|uniref:hypothetical protein n=1 Tax=Duganella rhizosphaerae TaxID=2885763 RepID=UPI0030EABEF5
MEGFFICKIGKNATMQELSMRKPCDLVIDAWLEREYAVDDVHGASNTPVMNNDEYAEVRTLRHMGKKGA